MNARTFLAGAVCGAVAYGVVSAVFDAGPETVPAAGVDETEALVAAESPAAGESVAESLGASPRATPIPPLRNGTGPNDDRAEDAGLSAIDEARYDAARRDSAQSSPAPPAGEAADDGPGPEAPATERDWSAERYAELMREPKDESWAYHMELALGQFLAGHELAPEFDLSYIECRTTHCQIEVVGYDSSTGPSWSQILYDMRQQPWYDFGIVGSAGGSVDGRPHYVANLERAHTSRSSTW